MDWLTINSESAHITDTRIHIIDVTFAVDAGGIPISDAPSAVNSMLK